MSSFENRIIKSKLVNILESLGYNVSATDSANITVFTDKPINKNSKRMQKSEGLKQPFITSFGTKGVLKFIEEHKIKNYTSQDIEYDIHMDRLLGGFI